MDSGCVRLPIGVSLEVDVLPGLGAPDSRTLRANVFDCLYHVHSLEHLCTVVQRYVTLVYPGIVVVAWMVVAWRVVAWRRGLAHAGMRVGAGVCG